MYTVDRRIAHPTSAANPVSRRCEAQGATIIFADTLEAMADLFPSGIAPNRKVIDEYVCTRRFADLSTFSFHSAEAGSANARMAIASTRNRFTFTGSLLLIHKSSCPLKRSGAASHPFTKNAKEWGTQNLICPASNAWATRRGDEKQANQNSRQSQVRHVIHQICPDPHRLPPKIAHGP
jgi:hypothetical protein